MSTIKIDKTLGVSALSFGSTPEDAVATMGIGPTLTMSERSLAAAEISEAIAEDRPIQPSIVPLTVDRVIEEVDLENSDPTVSMDQEKSLVDAVKDNDQEEPDTVVFA